MSNRRCQEMGSLHHPNWNSGTVEYSIFYVICGILSVLCWQHTCFRHLECHVVTFIVYCIVTISPTTSSSLLYSHFWLHDHSHWGLPSSFTVIVWIYNVLLGGLTFMSCACCIRGTMLWKSGPVWSLKAITNSMSKSCLACRKLTSFITITMVTSHWHSALCALC